MIRIHWREPPHAAVYNWDGTKGTKSLYGDTSGANDRQVWIHAPEMTPGPKFEKRVPIGVGGAMVALPFWKPVPPLLHGWMVRLGHFGTDEMDGYPVKSLSMAKAIGRAYLLRGEYPVFVGTSITRGGHWKPS
jgi:hypothetical protein